MIYALALACVMADGSEPCSWAETTPFRSVEECVERQDEISAAARQLAVALAQEHQTKAQWWALCLPLHQIRRIAPRAYAGEDQGV